MLIVKYFEYKNSKKFKRNFVTFDFHVGEKLKLNQLAHFAQ